MSISVYIHYRIICTDLLDRYHCFDRTRHWSKNRDLNPKYETVLCFAFLILCKAHFVALKVFTQGRLSSGTITKKLPTWYYLRGCQKYPCKKHLPISSLMPEISTVVIHSSCTDGWHFPTVTFWDARGGGRLLKQSQDHCTVLSFSPHFSIFFTDILLFWLTETLLYPHYSMFSWGPGISYRDADS